MDRARWQIVIAAGFVAGIAFAAAPAGAQPVPSAAAHAPAEVDLAFFHDRLASFGRWIDHPTWGEVWQPDSGSDFRPYFYGNWEYTSDYGWLWVSSEPYGDIVYHYGRWVYDPDDGWLWVPGYVWAPSWVVWRETDGYVGWLPMPPDYADFDAGAEMPVGGIDLFYGYQGYYGTRFVNDVFPYLWLFCADADFGHHDRRHYVTDHKRLHDLFGHSRDSTHYQHDRDRDHIVDRSIDPRELEQNGHSAVVPLPAARFVRRNVPVTPVSLGREIFRREHERKMPPETTRLPPAFGHSGGGVPGAAAGRDGNGAAVVPSPGSSQVPRVIGPRRQRGEAFGPNIPHTDSPAGALGEAQPPQPPLSAAPGARPFGGRGRLREGVTQAPRVAGPASIVPAAPLSPVPRAIAPIPSTAPAPIAPARQSQPSVAPPAVSTPPPMARFGRGGER